jgi:hypothetical protein
MHRKLSVACAVLAVLGGGCVHQPPATSTASIAPPSAANGPASQPASATRSTTAATPVAAPPDPAPPASAPAAPAGSTASGATSPASARPKTNGDTSAGASKAVKPGTTGTTTAGSTARGAGNGSGKAATTPATATATATATAQPTLDIKSLEQRLRDTKAIGVFTKLSLKNQVDDLLADMKAFHSGQPNPPLTELRQSYESLLLKVISVLQNGDPKLATAVSASRDAIWSLLADPARFAQLT